MERREKKREGLMVEKLKRGVLVGKRGGPSTPAPTWRLEFPSQQQKNGNNNRNTVQEFLSFPNSTLSARNLCAKLWEVQSHQLAPHATMSNPETSARRHRRDTSLEVPKQLAEPPPPHNPSHQPASDRCLRRQVQASVHRSVERNGCALQPVSPASYSSSMEVEPYNHVDPKSSLDLRGRIGESSCNPKTSTELVKVLNRIWCLEEQHASNKAIVKALKMELDLSLAQVKELLQEKQVNKQEMGNLMKQITENKLVRKNKEHDKIKAVVQSVKEEIEDERRLRKHSESLHQRLARELSEVKSSFCGTLRDLERERKARFLLENLCDDFAKGVRDYEHEVRSVMHSAEKGQVKGDDSLDRLILHISEAWLDERMQMKLVQSGSDLPETHSIVDKLGVDIETYLRAKRSVESRRYGNSSTKELREIYPCVHSLDSFPLKETINAPHNMAEEDSIGTEIFYQKSTAEKGLDKLSSRLHSNNASEVHKENKGSHNSASKQVQSKEITEECQLQANAGKKVSCDESESWFIEGKSSEIGGGSITLLNAPGVSTVCETVQGPPESDGARTKRMDSISHRLDNLVGNSSLSSEGDKVYPESICREDSCVHSVVTGNGSPVKQWKPTLIVPDFDKSESSSKFPSRGVKDNTLMAKLLEARLEGHKSRSRSSKSSF